MSVDKSFYEGWLWKWTNYYSGYQKRWFTLSNGVLSYYIRSEESNSGCRGNVMVTSARWFRENTVNFRIEADSSYTYYLKAADENDCDKWLDALDKMKTMITPSLSAVQGLTSDEVLKGMLLPIDSKLEELRTCCDASAAKGAALVGALAEMKKEIDSSPNMNMSKHNAMTKELKELVTLFRVTSVEMVKTGREFSDILGRHVNDWSSSFQNLDMRAVDFNRDEDNFQDAAEYLQALEDKQAPNSELAHMVSVKRRKRLTNHAILLESQHRKSIPYKPDYKLNLWSILKFCIGRDISKLPVPVNFGEPISILQKLAEELEYSELLDQAAFSSDPIMQLIYVAAFSASVYSTTAIRTGKPFNPMLGETYELDCMDELGFRYVAEQVCHHPPKAATYAESSKTLGHGGWSFWSDVTPSSKFRGNYLTLTPMGTSHVLFHDTGNHYTWTKATITVNNIILGKLWFDQSGVSEVTNHTTGDKCKMTYHQYNFYNPASFRKVSGTVIDTNGREKYKISGRWDQELRCTATGSHSSQPPQRNIEKILWKINPLPEKAELMYNFSSLAMILNEEVDSCAPTDSRNRPDQRKMEEGLWDDANLIKLELEERQRDRRKLLEADNSERVKKKLEPLQHQPLWFKRSKCPITKEYAYVYNHQYWEAKERQDWSRCPNIYDISGMTKASSIKDNWALSVKASRIPNSESSEESNSTHNSNSQYLPPLASDS